MVKCPKCGFPIMPYTTNARIYSTIDSIVIVEADVDITCNNCNFRWQSAVRKAVNME